jgi:tetratricopeptide (TPR) repeat protein
MNYDDQKYVYDNPVVQQGLTWKGLRWALTFGEIGHWHPLTWLSHMADCQIYGLWAGGHHLTNVALHTLSTVLLFLVLRSMTGALWRSAFVAAVFAVHPLRAESVAWIAERKDVLSGMFFMLTLWAYARYAKQPTFVRYSSVAILYALGLLAKNMLVTLPFVLLLLDWWPLGRLQQSVSPGTPRTGISFWGLVKEKIPLFLLSIASCAATALVPEKVAINAQVPVLERVANGLVSYLIYLRQMVFPLGLAVPYPFAPGGTPFWKAGTALVVIAGMTAGAVALRKRRPYLLVGWLWFVGMLVPVIGLVQISYYAHADRYTYLPGIGVTVAATWAVAEWSARWRYRTAVLGGLMLAVVGALTVWGHVQTSYWRDGESMWPHVLSITPSNAVAHFCLGAARGEKGANEEAIAQYRIALAIKPDYVAALDNLGMALFEQGDKAEALIQFHKALAVKPNDEEAWNGVGVVLFAQGNKEAAIAQYQKALEIKPDYAEARNNLGLALLAKGEKAQAMTQYRQALEIDPHYVKAHYNWGNALATDGQIGEAMAHFRTAINIKPDYAYARYGLGTTLYVEGQWQEAIEQYRQALKIRPDFPEVHFGLGKALLRQGDFDGAMASFEQVAAVRGNPLTSWPRLGSALLQKGDLEEAIICYQHAIKINQSSADAYANLGLAYFQKGEMKEAIDCWQLALKLKPDEASVQNNLAWLLATSPEAPLRDGAKAVALAEQANHLSAGGNAFVLHTLAAAYAETGRYVDATATARRALELAVEQKNDDLTGKLPKEIKLYEADRPVRDLPQ